MIRLTPFGGVNEIGGNKILLEDNDTRIFLDFGVSFDRREKFYKEYKEPKSIDDLLFTGLLPNIKGLYRFDSENKKAFDGIFLTHAHEDHYLYASFAKPTIPIFASYGTIKIIRAIHAPSPEGCDRRDLESEFTFRHTDVTENGFKTFEIFNAIERPFELKSFRIEPHQVDHSVPFGINYIITTQSGTLVYATDFRDGHYTRKFVKACINLQPKVMLCEGTHMGEKRDVFKDELEVKEKMDEILAKDKYPIFIEFSYKNLLRFYLLLDLVKKHGKQMVIPKKTAHVIDKVIPDVFEKYYKYIRIYGKSSYYKWEENIDRKYHDMIIADKEIKARPDEFVILFGFYQLNELAKLKPEGSTYIFSQTLPFTPRQKIEMEILKNWLELLKMKIIHVHCSGHMYQDELVKFINDVNPGVLIPIHTERPYLFKKLINPRIKVIVPETGKTVEFI